MGCIRQIQSCKCLKFRMAAYDSRPSDSDARSEVGDRLGEGPHATGCEHSGIERRLVNDLHQAGRRDGLL